MLPNDPQPLLATPVSRIIAIFLKGTPDHADIDHDRFHSIGELLYLEILPVAAAYVKALLFNYLFSIFLRTIHMLLDGALQ